MSSVRSTTSGSTQQCSCGKSQRSSQRAVKWATAGGLFAALGLCAACCLLPFALLSVGVAGVWVSTLDALARYKWVFVGLVAALLGYGFYVVYLKPRRACAAGAACEVCRPGRSVRIGLWVATILAIGGIVFEQVEPYLAH